MRPATRPAVESFARAAIAVQAADASPSPLVMPKACLRHRGRRLRRRVLAQRSGSRNLCATVFAPTCLCPIPQSMPYRNLHGRIGPILSIEPIGLGQAERWLRHEARLRAAMPLGRMNQEGMAQIDGARFSRRQGLAAVGAN